MAPVVFPRGTRSLCISHNMSVTPAQARVLSLLNRERQPMFGFISDIYM